MSDNGVPPLYPVDDGTYSVTVEKYPMSDKHKPSWNDAPKWANWLAQDGDLSWWWFEAEPMTDVIADLWYVNDGRIKRAGQPHIARPRGSIDPFWRSTLESRPETKESQ